MQVNISENVEALQPSSIRVVFETVIRLQKEGASITRLDIGSPNFAAPDLIVNSSVEHLKSGKYQYSSNWGLESLREALAAKYKKRANIAFAPSNEVIITNGSSEAVAMVICSLLNDDEHFLIPTPTWPHYIADCILFEKPYREIRTDMSSDFKLTPESLLEAIDENSRVLIINSPSNPTGCVYSKSEFKALYDICVSHNILLVLDEIYEDINFEFTDTLLNQDLDKENLIYINGFSKNYGMTGFRIGFLMASASLTPQLIKYHQYTTVCGQAFVQQASADFLEDETSMLSFRDNMLSDLGRSQKVLSDFYKSNVVNMTKPSGAFYSFMQIPDGFRNAEAFSMKLLEEKGVSVVPGSAFGEGYHDFYRISYGSVGPDALRVALTKILDYY